MIGIALDTGVGHGSRFCVCRRVFMTSSGLVKAAATAPAIEPALSCITMSNIIHSAGCIGGCVANFKQACNLLSVDNDNSMFKNFMI